MTIAPSSEKVDVEISFENGGNPASEGYIDYVRLEYQRALAGANHQYVFMSNLEDQLGTVMFTFSNSESIPAVWDVTDRFQIMMYPNGQNTGIQGRVAQMIRPAGKDEDKKY